MAPIHLTPLEKLIIGNQITMMRAQLMLLRCAPDVADTYGEKQELSEAIRESLAALYNPEEPTCPQYP